jgi:hypothetical protein
MGSALETCVVNDVWRLEEISLLISESMSIVNNKLS